MHQDLARRKHESAFEWYSRLNAARDEYVTEITPLIRDAKVEASIEANAKEMRRRADRDAQRKRDADEGGRVAAGGRERTTISRDDIGEVRL